MLAARYRWIAGLGAQLRQLCVSLPSHPPALLAGAEAVHVAGRLKRASTGSPTAWHGMAQHTGGTRGLRQGQSGSKQTQGNPALELPVAGNTDGAEGIASTSPNRGAFVEGSNETPHSAGWRELGHGQACREP